MATKRVTPVEKLTYEEAIVEMESIVEKMRTGELTLQDSVEAYKRGKELSLRCEMLLKEADCDYSHVAHLLVYLRDMADYTVVKRMFEERFSDIPKVYLWAPVCRPGWLIEMECMAVKTMRNEDYPSF